MEFCPLVCMAANGWCADSVGGLSNRVNRRVALLLATSQRRVRCADQPKNNQPLPDQLL